MSLWNLTCCLKIPAQRSAALEARSGRGRGRGSGGGILGTDVDTELELMFRSRKPAGEEKVIRGEKKLVQRKGKKQECGYGSH
jgi:hypothetical protein